MNQLMLPPAEAARVIGVGRTTLYALMRDGQVRAVKIGRRTLISIAELERYVASLTAGAGDADAWHESRTVQTASGGAV